MTLWIGVKATFVGWYIVWCERRYDRARARLARAVDLGQTLLEENR